MVTKRKAGQKQRRVKVGKLKLNKETVKDLSKQEARAIKGQGEPCTRLLSGCKTIRTM